jgi:hypothetical protein
MHYSIEVQIMASSSILQTMEAHKHTKGGMPRNADHLCVLIHG